MKRLLTFYKNLLIENRNWLRIVTVLFLLEVLVGALISFENPELMDQILKTFEEKFGADPGLDFNFVIAIFTQNLIAAIIALFGGVVLGLTSFLTVTVNGFLLGYVAAFIADPWVIIFGLFPHGIFELPGLLTASALGFKVGLRWLSRGAEGKRFLILKQDFKTAIVSLPMIVVILFLAALIEVYISGNLVR